MREIEKRLLCKGLVQRYETGTGVDGLPPGEGAFLACSFWLADNYLLHGPAQAEAMRLFNRLKKLANDVGLLPRNMIRWTSACWAISPRPFPMSR